MKRVISKYMLVALLFVPFLAQAKETGLTFTNTTNYDIVLVPYQARLTYQTPDPGKIMAKIPRGSLAVYVNYPQGVNSFAAYIQNPSTKKYQLIINQGSQGSHVVFHPSQVHSGTFSIANGSKGYAHKLYGPVTHLFREKGLAKWK